MINFAQLFNPSNQHPSNRACFDIKDIYYFVYNRRLLFLTVSYFLHVDQILFPGLNVEPGSK